MGIQSPPQAPNGKVAFPTDIWGFIETIRAFDQKPFGSLLFSNTSDVQLAI